MTSRITIALAMFPLLAACGESYIFLTADEVTASVSEQDSSVLVHAHLVYETAVLPEEAISNALRLTATSSADPDGDSSLTLTYPEGEFDDITGFQYPNGANLHGVFVDCGQSECELWIPVLITKETADAAQITITGDAILTTSPDGFNEVWDEVGGGSGSDKNSLGEADLDLIVIDPVQ